MQKQLENSWQDWLKFIYNHNVLTLQDPVLKIRADEGVVAQLDDGVE